MKFIAVAHKPGIHTGWLIKGHRVRLVQPIQVVVGFEMIIEEHDATSEKTVFAILQTSKPDERITIEHVPTKIAV